MAQAIAFALPVKKGDVVRRIAQEIESRQEADWHNQQKSHGISKLRVFHQRSPQEMVVVYMEADDLEGAFRSRAQSDHPFEDWLEKMIEEATGHHPDHAFRGPPSEEITHWDAQEGHKRKAAAGGR